MSVSSLPNYLATERRLLIVGNPLAMSINNLIATTDEIQVVSIHSLMETMRNFDFGKRLPRAILINLHGQEIHQITPVVRKIKERKKLRRIPIIGLTDQLSTTDYKKLLKLGFSDCYTGPIDISQLEKRIAFLTKYKTKLTSTKVSEEMPTYFKIPIYKRVFDFVFSSLFLLLFGWWIFLIVAILIKLESRGPVFYDSKRVGKGYQIFNFKKFRSMYTGADANLENLAVHNNYGSTTENSNKEATFFKMKGDPRVTKVGRILRKTSIDELPQMINVLKGEMSIVGNRPLPLYEAQKLTCDDWARRFLAPAGLTGLWQIDKRGKDTLSAKERIRLDVKYARKASFWLDMKIISKTLPAMRQRE